MLGNWTDLGYCKPKGKNADGTPCGPGEVAQRRICQDGWRENCDNQETRRISPCTLAEPSKPCGGEYNLQDT